MHGVWCKAKVLDTFPAATEFDDEETKLKEKKLQLEAMQKELAAQEAEMSNARAWCDKFETAHADYVAQVEKTMSVRKEHAALTEKMERATEAAATSEGCSVSARVCLLRQAEMLVEEHEQLTVTLKAAERLEKERHEDLLQARVNATMHSKAQKGIHAESSEDEANMKAAIMLRLKEKAKKTMHTAQPETNERDTLQEVEQDPEGYEKKIMYLQEQLRVAEELRKKELEHVAALEEKAKQDAEAAKKLALEEEKKKVELEAKKKAIEEQERKAKEEKEKAKKRAIEEKERKAKEEEDAKKRAIEEKERKAKEEEAKKRAIAEEQRLKDEAATRALEELQRGAMKNRMAEEEALKLASAESLNSKGGISNESAEIQARQEELLRQANIQRDVELQKQDAKKRLEREQQKAHYREQLADEAKAKEAHTHMATHGMHGGNVFAGQDSPHGFETPKRFAPPELTDEIKREIDAENAKRKAEIEDLEARYDAVRRRLHEAREKAAELNMRSGVAPSESSPEMSRLEYFMTTQEKTHACMIYIDLFVDQFFMHVFHFLQVWRWGEGTRSSCWSLILKISIMKYAHAYPHAYIILLTCFNRRQHHLQQGWPWLKFLGLLNSKLGAH